MFDSIANIKVEDLLKEKAAGEPVNVHVVTAPAEPELDYVRMRELLHGSQRSELPLDNSDE